MSYLVHKHWPCKANLRWTDVQQGCRADKKWKWAAASSSSFNVHILEMFIWFTYIIHIYSIYIYIYIYFFMYSLYFITFQRSGTRPVTKPLRSIRPEQRGTFHTQFWLIAIYIQSIIPIHKDSGMVGAPLIPFSLTIAWVKRFRPKEWECLQLEIRTNNWLW